MNTQRQKVENSRIMLYLHDFEAQLPHKKYRFIFAERLFSDILNLSKYNTHHKHETALQVQETQTVKPYVLCKQKDIKHTTVESYLFRSSSCKSFQTACTQSTFSFRVTNHANTSVKLHIF